MISPASRRTTSVAKSPGRTHTTHRSAEIDLDGERPSGRGQPTLVRTRCPEVPPTDPHQVPKECCRPPSRSRPSRPSRGGLVRP